MRHCLEKVNGNEPGVIFIIRYQNLELIKRKAGFSYLNAFYNVNDDFLQVDLELLLNLLVDNALDEIGVHLLLDWLKDLVIVIGKILHGIFSRHSDFLFANRIKDPIYFTLTELELIEHLNRSECLFELRADIKN